ncbi:hypothetical protein PIB30_024462 [Stylosanthes scabra]|uniref:Uncharacterized protein n=1 Tax=Stylosanthes scabra TaxID=79078 RepID=A0ABU6X863_9FABA|nr:hypothetical protein [Stylosanthes scabra]
MPTPLASDDKVGPELASESAGDIGEQEAQSNIESTASTDGGRAAMVAGVGIFSLTRRFTSSLLLVFYSSMVCLYNLKRLGKPGSP